MSHSGFNNAPSLILYTSASAATQSPCLPDNTNLSKTKRAEHVIWMWQLAKTTNEAYLRIFSTIAPPPPVAPSASLEVKRDRFPIQHPWLAVMRHGSVATVPAIRRQYAEAVVICDSWDPQTMSVLASKLTDRMAEGPESELGVVAPFACALYEEFKSKKSEESALLFRHSLRECVLSEFLARWQTDLLTCMDYGTRQIDPTRVYSVVPSALAVATFIADLFSQALLSAVDVHHCLIFLMEKLHLKAHVHAVHDMLYHANKHLYDPQIMFPLMYALRRQALILREIDMGNYIQETCVLICNWATGPPASSALFDETLVDGI